MGVRRSGRIAARGIGHLGGCRWAGGAIDRGWRGLVRRSLSWTLPAVGLLVGGTLDRPRQPARAAAARGMVAGLDSHRRACCTSPIPVTEARPARPSVVRCGGRSPRRRHDRPRRPRDRRRADPHRHRRAPGHDGDRRCGPRRRTVLPCARPGRTAASSGREVSLYDQDIEDPSGPRRARQAAAALTAQDEPPPPEPIPEPEPEPAAEPSQLTMDLGPVAEASCVEAAADVDARAWQGRGDRPADDRGARARTRGSARAARSGDPARRHDRRADRHPLRARARQGVKVAKVTSLHKDIAYAMAAPDVRIQAPIPGRSAIGVEVPNTRRQIVHLGDILVLARRHAESSTRSRSPWARTSPAGRCWSTSPTSRTFWSPARPAPGSRAASTPSSPVVLMRSTPDQVRLIMIDPKRVELGQYNGIPHLLTQVVVNPKKAANALAWAVTEMERRYDLLPRGRLPGHHRLQRGVRPRRPRRSRRRSPRATAAAYSRLPFILVVVDELADLMMVAARDVEESICRLAQMARAVGIHLVIATQRPSVDVITGLIKANIPSRISFAVSGLTDSRVILDQAGAEKLVGKGDMLLLGSTSSVARAPSGRLGDRGRGPQDRRSLEEAGHAPRRSVHGGRRRDRRYRRPRPVRGRRGWTCR